MSFSVSATSGSGPATTTTTTAPKVDVCIIGGGIGGCAAAASLFSSPSSKTTSSTVDESLDVMLLEMGRGVGGRASTRFTRDDDRIAINHGAPHADIRTFEGRNVMRQLEKIGFAQRSSSLVATNKNDQEDGSNNESVNVEYWTGNPTMHRLSEGLLEKVLPNKPQYLFRSMVRKVVPMMNENTVEGWRLMDKDDHILAETKWLLLAGSGMAHPRWTDAFGGEPPLLAAAKLIGSSELDRVLKIIGNVSARPVQAALMAYDLDDANTEVSIKTIFNNLLKERNGVVLETPGDSVLDKIVIQRNGNNMVSVVGHSNAEFAESAKDTYGSTSTAARIGGAASSADREQEVLSALMDAITRNLATSSSTNMDDTASCATVSESWGPFLHRWGNAFPVGSSLQVDDAIVKDAKVAFCGDYVGSQERFGTLEGALLSGQEIGEKLKSML